MKAIEDRAIREAIALQEEVGLPIVTDGEFRRRLFFSTVESLFDGLDPEGFVRTHRDEAGNVEELRTPAPVARLKRRKLLADVELDFTLAHTDRPVKVTMPSPSLLDVYWTEEVSGRAYPTREAYLEHLVELMHEDAVALAARGAAHIQLDAPHYAYIQAVLPDVGDRDATLRRLVECDNRVLRGVEGVTTCCTSAAATTRAASPAPSPTTASPPRSFRMQSSTGSCSSTTTSAPAASPLFGTHVKTRRSCWAS